VSWSSKRFETNQNDSERFETHLLQALVVAPRLQQLHAQLRRRLSVAAAAASAFSLIYGIEFKFSVLILVPYSTFNFLGISFIHNKLMN
jgi:hypothetical protein